MQNPAAAHVRAQDTGCGGSVHVTVHMQLPVPQTFFRADQA